MNKLKISAVLLLNKFEFFFYYIYTLYLCVVPLLQEYNLVP